MQKEIEILLCLFDDNITAPEVKEPDEPVIKVGKSNLTKTQTSIDNARIVLFIKEERSLNSAIIALYNVMRVNAVLCFKTTWGCWRITIL